MVLTTFSEEAYVERALGSGVSGFLLKSADPRELIAKLQAVAGGGAALSPVVARRVIDTLGGERLGQTADARNRLAPLTGHEREVVALLAASLLFTAPCRTHRIIRTCERQGVPVLADHAYIGAGPWVTTGLKRPPGGELTLTAPPTGPWPLRGHRSNEASRD